MFLERLRSPNHQVAYVNLTSEGGSGSGHRARSARPRWTARPPDAQKARFNPVEANRVMESQSDIRVVLVVNLYTRHDTSGTAIYADQLGWFGGSM